MVRSLEGRDDEVPVIPVVQTRPDEHFLIMSEFPPRVYPSVIEVFDRARVDLRRESRWICQHPRMKAVMGIAARKARPALLCFRPVPALLAKQARWSKARYDADDGMAR
ncbi:hypothetical protein KC333_g88 [Hortaea werneckii]|nr:hypothetical protein KC333_g88 [Hortaea werneckii]